jgi:RsiW-degrading membrane proteinase PrsW (M82 family)
MIRAGINITIAAVVVIIFIGIFFSIVYAFIIFILGRRLWYLDAFASLFFFNQLKITNEKNPCKSKTKNL